MAELVNVNNQLHQAGFFVEHMKYGQGRKKTELVGRDEFVDQLTQLLDAAGIEGIKVEDVCEALPFFGEATMAFGIPHIVGMSIWTDGLMHGLALSAKLKGPVPEQYLPDLI